MEFVKGKMYVSRHTEIRKGQPLIFDLVVLCTGKGEEPKWGIYPTLSGVVVKNTDKWSDHQVGNYSGTWNASQFTEEYVGKAVVDNINYRQPMGTCNG